MQNLITTTHTSDLFSLSFVKMINAREALKYDKCKRGLEIRYFLQPNLKSIIDRKWQLNKDNVRDRPVGLSLGLKWYFVDMEI